MSEIKQLISQAISRVLKKGRIPLGIKAKG